MSVSQSSRRTVIWVTQTKRPPEYGRDHGIWLTLVLSIFRRKAMRSLMIEHAAKITAINPSAARFTLEEMFGLVLMGVSILGNVFAARNLHSSLFSFRRPQCFSFDESYSGIGFAPCRASIIRT